MMSLDEADVELRRYLAAAPQKVFAAFAEAGLVARWLTPAPDITLTLLEFDFREGGTYRFAYTLPHGGTVIVGGTYRLIEPPKRIVFTWIIEPPDEHAGIESEVTISITPESGGTELVIQHKRLSRADARARHAEGWRGAMDRLTKILGEEAPSHDG
jgi:uncharacterized protein YndB with AHSA1/START domain